MRILILLAVTAAAAASPAVAAEVKVKPLLDGRLRYENVDQQGFPREADALTLRLRPGAELTAGDWSLLVEGEGTWAIVEGYNSGLNGKTARPLVPDPENLELNRLQIQYRGLPKTLLTAGRQRINLEDQRFVGSVGWRQNEQTFDAVRAEWSGLPRVKADLTYAWSVRTIWGVDGKGPRQQAISGDNVFAILSYRTPIGALSGFAYLVDQDEP
ncbi:MAG: alginate export family protein, partial [Sphingomonadales bacterium]